jgi:L-iditol 2-dehydrogenase
MKAVAVLEQDKVAVVELPMPTVRPYECLVKMRASGFCNTTDLKIIHNELAFAKVEYPLILGHEGVGEVVETGPQVRNYKIGDVFLNPHCRIEPGTPYHSMWGNMMEYAIVQDRQVMDELQLDKSAYCGWGVPKPVPREISFEDYGVVLTLLEAYSAVKNFGVRPGHEVLIYGDGPIGLELAHLVRLAGAQWVGIVGHRAHRLERIGRLAQMDFVANAKTEDVEAKLGERKFDLVIDAVGSMAIIQAGAKRLKPGGKLGAYGTLKRKDANVSLVDLPNNISLHILNLPHIVPGQREELLQFILAGQIKPQDYYSHVLPLTDAVQAVQMIETREAFKVVFAC